MDDRSGQGIATQQNQMPIAFTLDQEAAHTVVRDEEVQLA